MLFSRIVSAAPFAFLKRMERMKRPGSVPAGQPALHGASWQSRQRAASSIAVRCVKPARDSEAYSAIASLLNSINLLQLKLLGSFYRSIFRNERDALIIS
jgi:hypothetical protein